MSNNVKKTLITIGIIIVIAAACFFGGYSFGRTRFDDSRIDQDTELIRKQNITIKSLEGKLRGSIEQVGILAGEVTELEKEAVEFRDEIAKFNSGVGNIEEGLQTGIEGISGVIERLKHYRGESEVLEKGNSN